MTPLLEVSVERVLQSPVGKVNRAAVWILGTISGLILVYGISLVSFTGFGISRSCASTGVNPAPCTPVLQQAVVDSPLVNPLVWVGLVVVLLAALIGLPAWIGGPISAERRGSSSRTANLVVSIVASALFLVTLLTTFVLSPALATPETCISSTAPDFPCFYGVQAKLVAVFGVSFGMVRASLLIGVPAWVMALTETGRHRRWEWFAAVLLLSPFAAMLYAFFGGQQRPPAAAVAPAVAPTGA